MTIGLFLDVDSTLTDNAVQGYVAKALDCENGFQDIENAFQKDPNGDSDHFGAQISELYRKNGLTRDRAESICKDIIKAHLRPQARDLLKLHVEFSDSVTTYLVSNGPNYFVELLAKEFQIPTENVICSKYEFEDGREGRISRCSRAITPTQKTGFVKSKAEKHPYTVGLGDSYTLDTFVQACSVGFYLNPAPEGFVCRNLKTFHDFMRELLPNFRAKPDASLTAHRGVTINSAWQTLTQSGPLVALLLAGAGAIFLAGRLSTLLHGAP